MQQSPKQKEYNTQHQHLQFTDLQFHFETMGISMCPKCFQTAPTNNKQMEKTKSSTRAFSCYTLQHLLDLSKNHEYPDFSRTTSYNPNLQEQYKITLQTLPLPPQEFQTKC